jgi:DNA-damage-inducible protein J
MEMVKMADTTNISIRMDTELKKQAEKLFNELGMNMTTAFNIFLRQSVRQQRIPFDVALETPNPETLAAMEEAERISRDPSVKGYLDVDQLMKDLTSDV